MKFWIFLCFLALSLMSFGQVILEIPLRTNFKKEPIKENGIQSVVAFAETNEAGIIKRNGGRSGKILDIEFDSTGQVSYKRKVDPSQRLPFLKSRDYDHFEYFNFDQRGELLYLYREDYNETYELIRKFNSDGKLIQFMTSIDGRASTKSNFKWEDGKMVEYTESLENVDYSISQTYYDEEGRFTKFETEDFQLLYEYAEHGDTVVLTETISDSSMTRSIETYTYLKQLKDRYTHYTYENETGELIVELKVSYDETGNATSYNLLNFDRSNGKYSEKPSVNYRIENIYDARDLLISRIYYCMEEHEETERLVRIDRYIYSKEPLVVKYKKGELVRY